MAKKKPAKKPETIRRRMISVPPELNARLGEYADVNWSAVACTAFRAKLGELGCAITHDPVIFESGCIPA